MTSLADGDAANQTQINSVFRPSRRDQSPCASVDRRPDDNTSVDRPMTYNKYCILAVYQFVTPTVSDEEAQCWRGEIDAFLRQFHARGSLLIAVEGINGTICFPSEHQEAIEYFLRSIFPNIKMRRSYNSSHVYHRLKVRIKNEIVTMGHVPHYSASPESNDKDDLGILRPKKTGHYVKPGPEWDALLHDPDCLVIDTRNDYEIELGTFKGAVNPHTSQFPEFPAWLRERLMTQNSAGDNSGTGRIPAKIALFCTGGIRCEKASAYCLDLLSSSHNGNDYNGGQMPSVYHLEGGILAYLDTVPADQSTFVGECFVFDKRTAVTHGLKPSEIYVPCHACRHPVKKGTESFQEGLYCPRCFGDKDRRRERYAERQKQIELWAQKGVPHLHDPSERKNPQSALSSTGARYSSHDLDESSLN